MDDEELLQTLRRSPDEGMRVLIDRYAGLVYGIIRRKLSAKWFCEADVESCAADVFSEFYCDLDSYRPEAGSIRSWLCVMTRNNAIDLLRRKKKEQDRLEPEEDLAEDFSLEDEVVNRQTRLALMKAIRELGEPDHEILVRKFFFGQSSREIGEKLQLSAVNVDTRTHRALKKLRERFGKEWRGEG